MLLNLIQTLLLVAMFLCFSLAVIFRKKVISFLGVSGFVTLTVVGIPGVFIPFILYKTDRPSRAETIALETFSVGITEFRSAILDFSRLKDLIGDTNKIIQAAEADSKELTVQPQIYVADAVVRKETWIYGGLEKAVKAPFLPKKFKDKAEDLSGKTKRTLTAMAEIIYSKSKAGTKFNEADLRVAKKYLTEGRLMSWQCKVKTGEEAYRISPELFISVREWSEVFGQFVLNFCNRNIAFRDKAYQIDKVWGEFISCLNEVTLDADRWKNDALLCKDEKCSALP